MQQKLDALILPRGYSIQTVLIHVNEVKEGVLEQEFFSHIIRPLSKLHLVAKIAIFGIFSAKFFDHVYIHALKIFQKICIKVANFIKQSEFRKRSIDFSQFLH